MLISLQENELLVRSKYEFSYEIHFSQDRLRLQLEKHFKAHCW